MGRSLELDPSDLYDLLQQGVEDRPARSIGADIGGFVVIEDDRDVDGPIDEDQEGGSQARRMKRVNGRT